MLVSLALLTAGCESKEKAPLVPVKGQLWVKYKDGRRVPMDGARIVLVPVGDGKSTDDRPCADTAADGTFVLGTRGKNDGAPEGDYTVTVEWKKQDKGKETEFTLKFKEKFKDKFPDVRLVTVEEVFGGWDKVQAEHFADGGLLDQAYGKR